MLKLIDITKEYRVLDDVTLALHDVSIEFRKSEFVAILGPSGCGKTTLLNIVGGLDRYTSGDIQIDGISTKEYDDVDWDTYRNRRVGFVFQSYNLIPHMNILKNVALCLTLAGVKKEERTQKALEVLKKVGLDKQAKKKPNQLSGGQMQRVAIARALVNNPDIILADEPTGALDSESGMQVMDLLKEVAEDRLVIMVTHNPQLADKYSTRIVYLKDGEVVGDTMSYDGDAETGEADTIETQFEEKTDKEIEVTIEKAADETVAVSDKSVEQPEAVNGDEVLSASGADEKIVITPKKTTQLKKMSKWMVKMLKHKEKAKSSMNIATAIALSWNNLVSKKGRTFLTSMAGSIGIIGIILVLALSGGATNYVTALEENALSQYPLTINQSNMDMTSIMSMLLSEKETRENYPDTDTIYTKMVLGNVLGNLGSMLQKNDLHSLKKYIEGTSEYGAGTKFDTSLATVRYNYGTTFNAYTIDPRNAERVQNGEEEIYMKVNPYTEVMGDVMDETLNKPEFSFLKDVDFGGMNATQALNQFGTMMGDPWVEMSSNQELLNKQYEIVGGNWPTSANEIVIVVDSRNQVQDYELFMLGLKSQDDIFNALQGGSFAESEFDIDQLLNLKYKILTNADYLDYDEVSDSWISGNKKEQSKTYVDTHYSFELDVVGVIRPKEGVSVTSINGIIGYTHALSEMMIDRAENHPAIQEQLERYAYAVEHNNTYYVSALDFNVNTAGGTVRHIAAGDQIIIKSEHEDFMRELGVADMDYPKAINFFCSSFAAKDAIVQYIDQYNETTNSKVKYSDNLSVIMGYVNTLTTTITGVLVGFAAISLIVSTIMIAIIIYTSVLERRKEIGVLRSIGARKKDISRVFIAESAILGGYSGLIGLFFSYLISLLGSAILKKYFEIPGLMEVAWWHCVMMFLISVLLSMFAGFIPSRIAAKRDPAVALRAE